MKIKTINKNADEIINEFYNWRLKFYDKRKELILNKLQSLKTNKIKEQDNIIPALRKYFGMLN